MIQLKTHGAYFYQHDLACVSFTVRMYMNNYTTHDPFICMIPINALSHDDGLVEPAHNSGC